MVCRLTFLSALAVACGGGSDDRDADGDGAVASVDCDDEDAAVHPDAVEFCDGIDNDCDRDTDEGLLASFWADSDGDTYGSTNAVEACGLGPGVADNPEDCDDHDASVHPGAEELCNGHDDDCDGEDRFLHPWYEDLDGDGYGNIAASVTDCYPPSGYVELGTDCDDANPEVSPAEPEQCDNEIDDDCDGNVAEGADADGDGHITDTCVDGDDCDDGDPDVHVGAVEVCGDGIDADCNGRDLFCGYDGDYDLADAGATLECNLGSYDAGRLVESGDVTGDGIGDVFLATLYGDAYKGGGYILPGPMSGDYVLEDDAFRLASGNETYGASRSIGLGDTNADGIEDVSFGAPYSNDNGQYLVYGPITADLDIAESADAKLVGRRGIYCAHGSDLGDLDGDGYEDAVVGAYNDNTGGSGSGTLFVEFGPVTGSIDLEVDADVEIAGARANAYAGRMVHSGEDVNGDGLGDFGANAVYDSTGGPGAGGVYVIYGPASIDALDDADGFLVGEGPGASAGTAFTMDDFDGDGLADVASFSWLRNGVVSIVYGPASGEIDLGVADTLIEGDTMGQQLGSGLGSGDVDADDVDELLIGAPGDRACGNGCGAAFLVFAPPSGTWEIGDVAQASFWGANTQDQTGQGVSIGDLDGDGFGELILGGPGISTGGGAHVVFPAL